MRAQRPPGAARCLAGIAESLPFADANIDVVMSVFSDWHWRDQRRGFAEMRRVARERVLVLTLDRSAADRFWLSREYLPGAHELWGSFEKTLEHMGRSEVLEIPIPGDCVDGFFHAYWRRPHLSRRVDSRDAGAVSAAGAEALERALNRLRPELERVGGNALVRGMYQLHEPQLLRQLHR